MTVCDMWGVAGWAVGSCGLDVWLRVVESEARSAMAAVCPPTGVLAVDQAAYEYGYYAGVADLAAVFGRKVKS